MATQFTTPLLNKELKLIFLTLGSYGAELDFASIHEVNENYSFSEYREDYTDLADYLIRHGIPSLVYSPHTKMALFGYNESGEYVIQPITQIDSENDLDEIFIKQRTYYLEHQMEKLLWMQN